MPVFSARPAVLNLYCFIVPVTMIRIIIYIDLLLPFCSHLLLLSNYFTSTHMHRFTRDRRRRFLESSLSLGAQCHAGSAASSFNKNVNRQETKRINWKPINHTLLRFHALAPKPPKSMFTDV